MADMHELRHTFAPEGILRASINLGNPILAARSAEGGQPSGVSVDLAYELGKQLGVAVELIVHDSAGKSVKCVEDGGADIGFFAIDPMRAEKISFTEAYVLIEGCYLVRDSSPLTTNDQVDRNENHVVVGRGSAYDLFLSRELHYAKILRAPTSPLVVDTFIAENMDVAAGVKQQLEADTRRFPGLRLLPGSFMTIRQAMGVRRCYGEPASRFLSQFVENMKREGFIAASLEHNNVSGAAVAALRT
ncbi:ABC transporter substrate-binding protein [Acetobacter thailandicus]|uniref:ABC transporter substrate-binding protein n=1 Tax=Acetobacter thailandicus TaxID=1502842 RepID=A0ABT3QCN8_9PROT|nr:ABC transporter substrate-binding protein [Acetobacter thailandicus]MCX2563029.1 ABC transporter substrate-binding protein [Acetobacter thailandicus]NHN96297.1 transporter substrate-binding domain-containing protein [Acetobacter thailandicus]